MELDKKLETEERHPKNITFLWNGYSMWHWQDEDHAQKKLTYDNILQ